jgi:putative hydrolase of the HAD superfamily
VTLRPFSAVVFDLYETLVPGGGRLVRDAVSAAMAADLGVEPSAFAAQIRASFDERARGLLGDLPSTVEALAARIGGTPSSAAIQVAAARRLDLVLQLLQAPVLTVSVLRQLRAAGYRLGLVSDCSVETPTLWAETPLACLVDVAVFSCVEGVRKPDPGLYRSAARGLHVDLSECVYVGDGASDELNGAEAAGMTAIQLRAEHLERDDAADHALIYGARPWHGPTVEHLTELPTLLATMRSRR